MKKIFATALSVALSISAFAADWLPGIDYMYDAMTYSTNQYAGSARTLALGNAVTALGGDLGMVVMNPAASAVAPYSQFTLTPGLSIASSSAAFSADGSAFTACPGITKTRFTVPDVSLSLVMDTGNGAGVKNIVFSFEVTQTADFLSSTSAYGRNPSSSYFAKMASAAKGLDDNILSKRASFFNSDYPWDLLAARQSGSIGLLTGTDSYLANTQVASGGKVYQPGTINQQFATQRWGTKTDIILNLGANVGDWLYFGLNIGLPYSRYTYQQAWVETPTAEDASRFVQTFTGTSGSVTTLFQRSELSYNFTSSIDGIYAKLGVIAAPIPGLRLGAAIKTPTMYTITEKAGYVGKSTFENNAFSTGIVTFPESDSYTYNLRSPFEFNVGVAYAFGTLGLISADYELMDYSVMRLSEIDDNFVGVNAFNDLNLVMNKFCGQSHSLRLGGEINLNDFFALRAGWSFLTSPEKYYTDTAGNEVYAEDYYYTLDYFSLRKAHYIKNTVTAISFGLGFNPDGPFFMDLAARRTRTPEYTSCLYAPYQATSSTGVSYIAGAPEANYNNKLWNVALTFGWRF